MDEYILGITPQNLKLTNMKEQNPRLSGVFHWIGKLLATECFVRILSEENEYKNDQNSETP
jgi:hypothetical protein